MKATSYFALFCLLFVFVNARRTLVLVDDLSIKNTHSLFFQSLTDRGYSLDFHSVRDDEIHFEKFGHFLYDSLIIFASSSDEWNEEEINISTILKFIDEVGGNVLIAGEENVSDFISELASENGVEFGKYGYNVIDHINYDSRDFDGEHTVIVANNFVNTVVLGNKKINPVLYKGNGLQLSKKNRLVFPILSGSSSAFIGSPSKAADANNGAGTDVVLVAGLQARNNARVVVSGSLELFGDNFIQSDASLLNEKAKPSGNKEFVEELSKWVFGERGVLRLTSVSHHRLGETEAKTIYTVNDTIVYTVHIEEKQGDKWVGYVADDVQLDVQMLDPKIRTTLKPDGNGKFTTTFIAPDVYGVYTYKLDYHRLGYSSLSDRIIVTIRPYRHDEYERFIVSAYPYYASAFSMMAGVLFFSFLFLFSK